MSPRLIKLNPGETYGGLPPDCNLIFHGFVNQGTQQLVRQAEKSGKTPCYHCSMNGNCSSKVPDSEPDSPYRPFI